MLSHWLGWISLSMCILLLAKYIGRISNNKSANIVLRRIHKPLGIAVIGIGAIHGLICFIKYSQKITENFSGIILWLLIALLALTYYARIKLKSRWVHLHRHLAILLIAILVIHAAVAIS